MRFKLFLAFVSIAFCKPTLHSQTFPLIPSDSVISLLKSLPDSGTIVINFWATWCGPCVHEMPFFVKADSNLVGENVTFIFISFDPSANGKQVAKFVSKNSIPGSHYIIGNYDMNSFIDKVDPKWEGGIPYTIVITNKGRTNHEGAFETYRELWQFIRE